MPLSSSAQYQLDQQKKIARQAPASPGTQAPTQQKEQEKPSQPQPDAYQVAPDPSTWDYKTSLVNLKGETLPAGAKSWTPFGNPYFGPGLSGTLKKYAYSLMGSPTQGPEADRWKRFVDLTANQQSVFSPQGRTQEAATKSAEATKLMAGGLFGTEATQETGAQDLQKVKLANARIQQIAQQYRTPNGVNLNAMPDDVRKEYQDLQETIKSGTVSAAEGKTAVKVGGQNISLLTPVIRATGAGLQVLMDSLSEASIKFEQLQGVNSAMRDYAQANSNLPALAFDVERNSEKKSEAAQNVANIASRLIAPALTSWDAFRFWTAPGTLKQKTEVLKGGYDAGRILYSQAIKPALLEEFKRRAQAGEDPQLLAMELQNPWAEGIGQAVLDPLNLIGIGAKTAKAASMLDDATDLVKGGKLGEEAANIMGDAGKVMAGPLGETSAAAKMGQFDDLVVKNVERLEATRLTPDYNSITAYSPSGMRVRETKVIQTTGQIVTSAIMRGGGTADDVADFMHYLSKATSTDKAARLEAWDAIMTLSQRYGMGRYAFSDDALETGILLRNLVEDKDLLPMLKAGKGDLAKTAEILNAKFQAAVEKQIPTYTQVKKGAEAFRTGTDVSKQAEKLAAKYEQIKPGARALWNLHEGKVGDFKNAVNSLLGKFFFSQPGFVARNASNNLMTMFVDQGLGGTAKSFYRDGKFWSIADIEDDLMKYFGGKLPPATSGITLTKSEKAETAVSKLNDAVESGFAKRIYWKQFRDTMDKFLRPGVALPGRQEFKAIGLSEEQIDHFVHILKNEAYGNVEQAIIKYSEKHSGNGLLDVWRRWNGSVSTEEMKGLSEIGLTKQLDDIASNAQTPQEIKDKISALKRELQNRAATAADNPIGVNRERSGFEFMDGIGKAEKEGMLDVDGTNKLNILIEQSEKASDELLRAIGKARDTVVDPALRQQFSVMEEAFSATRRGAARKSSQELVETAWDLTHRAKKSTGLEVEKMWNQSILAKGGPAPAGATSEQFLQELWKATRNDVSNTWETYFANGFDRLTPLIDNLTEQFPELKGIFAKSQKASADLNMYRTAVYRDGKIFYSQPPMTVAQLAQRYGVSSATEAGVPLDQKLLNEINKYSDVKFKNLQEAQADLPTVERALQNRSAAKGVEVQKGKQAAQTAQKGAEAKAVSMEKATSVPRDELPPEVSQEFERVAKELQSELHSGFGPTVQQAKQGTEAFATTSTPTTNIDWYRELYQEGIGRKQVDAALDRIVQDAGADKGGLKAVERLKELIIERIRYGAPDQGIPPNLKLLQQMGADEKTMAKALDDYNEITRQEKTLEEVLGAAPGGAPEQAAQTAGDFTYNEAGDLVDAAGNVHPGAYFDDSGNLITPQNPEVEIQPPYVDGSPPLPGEAWKQNLDGAIATLNKVEKHMLDNFGLKAVDKLEGSQLKALKGIMKDARGRITEGIAIADKIGKEWRDFALLPYGETRNFDLAYSYALPYGFWYRGTYPNWMKRVATDPAVIANYARLKETMSNVNKDSPEWWRYNVEIPSHFLGLPNEHPMSFNLEANLWPLYGITGTDFNDPEKRTNWFTSTVDDVGKMGPSVWSPIQWAIALAYRAKGEEDIAQAWAGRVIPQTATIKAVSSYFGQPLELDPAVQIFSGNGIMDLQAMDKWERNRVGRAITAMVQSGEITQEQALEVARTQQGPVWDDAVRRATQLRAPGQISSYFFGVGMKARTEQDRVTDEFYQEFYRLQNLNEADLISPEKYQEGWDALRERYPFMDALLLSRKAGPERDRAYAYNVLGRIPPGQASELYKLAGIDPEVAREFYDNKGEMKGWSESKKERFMAAMVDLGATLAIPSSGTKQEWNAARRDYADMKDLVTSQFGEDIYDKRDYYYSLEGAQKDAYKAMHPEIDQSKQLEDGFMKNSTMLMKYYGGIETLERYYNAKMYDTLEQKFGDLQPIFDHYYQLQLTSPKEANKFKKIHPEMNAYSKMKNGLQQDNLAQILKFSKKLPEGPELNLRGDFTSGSPTQTGIAGYAAQRAPSKEDFQQALGSPLMNILNKYYADLINDPSKAKLPYQASNELDFQAGKLGYNNGDDLLRDVLLSLQQS